MERDIWSWRLGLDGEAEQLAMVRQEASGRRLMIFQHKPLYMRVPDEAILTQSALYPEHRHRLKEALSPAGDMLICSGHIHDYKTAGWDNLKQVWAPSTAFVIDRDGLRNPVHGARGTGYVVHTLDGDDHSHAFVEPDGFLNIDLGNWMRAPETFHGRYHAEPLRGLVLSGAQI